MICGQRDGSVVLLDSRVPASNQNSARLTANRRVGGGETGGHKNGNHRQGAVGIGSSRRSGATKYLLDCGTSSVDHVHALKDGARCLVKDKLGGLLTLDLRFSGRGPLKVLVPPVAAGQGGGAARAMVPGRFAMLDSEDTIVVTAISTATPRHRHAADRSVEDMVGGVGGERFASSPRAWDAFSGGVPRSTRAASVIVDHNNSSCDVSSPGRGEKREAVSGFRSGLPGVLHGGKNGRGSSCTGDRLLILSVSTGEMLNEIATPWRNISLARGGAATVGPGPGPLGRGGKRPGCHGEFQFLGIASLEAREKATTVFEGSLQPEGSGKFGQKG